MGQDRVIRIQLTQLLRVLDAEESIALAKFVKALADSMVDVRVYHDAGNCFAISSTLEVELSEEVANRLKEWGRERELIESLVSLAEGWDKSYRLVK